MSWCAIGALTSERTLIARDHVLRVDLEDEWPEQDPNAALNTLLGVQVLTLRDLIDSLEVAASDDAIAALELRVGDISGGWATKQEIRDAILDGRPGAPGDFRRFLCVEAALIETPARLAAGEQWWGRQTLIAG